VDYIYSESFQSDKVTDIASLSELGAQLCKRCFRPSDNGQINDLCIHQSEQSVSCVVNFFYVKLLLSK